MEEATGSAARSSSANKKNVGRAKQLVSKVKSLTRRVSKDDLEEFVPVNARKAAPQGDAPEKKSKKRKPSKRKKNQSANNAHATTKQEGSKSERDSSPSKAELQGEDLKIQDLQAQLPVAESQEKPEEGEARKLACPRTNCTEFQSVCFSEMSRVSGCLILFYLT